LLVQQGETSGSGVELPADLIQTLYNALIQVYQATDEPARSSSEHLQYPCCAKSQYP
jgi:hypothetical protein